MPLEGKHHPLAEGGKGWNVEVHILVGKEENWRMKSQQKINWIEIINHFCWFCMGFTQVLGFIATQPDISRAHSHLPAMEPA